MTGKPLKILQAIRVIPHGVQAGLEPVKLYNQLEVDPLRDDLAVKLVELRASLKNKNPELAAGLKVAANSAGFGLLCQMNVKDLDQPWPLHVFSGRASYFTPIEKVWEQPAEFYCPVMASLVTGGSHLLCAMLERICVVHCTCRRWWPCAASLICGLSINVYSVAAKHVSRRL
jgi:hypothetical protein